MVEQEKKLWAACMENAIQDLKGKAVLCSNKMGSPKKREQYQQDAKKWFMSCEYDVGSFLWICDMIGVESKKIMEVVLHDM